VFLLNSRLDLFTAAPSGNLSATLTGHPFSQSYGAILPSSLTRVLPCALGSSPRLPVSVCGTGTALLARGFSCQCGCRDFATLSFTPHHGSRSSQRGICLALLSHRLDRHIHPPAPLPSCVPPSLNRNAVVQESPPVLHRLRSSASA
jgi:hypothetical protein